MNLKEIRSRLEKDAISESELSPETLDNIIHIVHEQMNKERGAYEQSAAKPQEE